ncbi:family 1 glycosylhydrolase [Cryobacterium mannosilyticum]|uniref:Glycosyl hydrolase family protein n=1 Tax=Cryobacterium mannosilyticum TaxID=1259190 RepID=A0A4R8WCW7_9MICO|nr:family 1 glycosylhydrolase [Cryobacterium mannosilyticum]TFC06371.1 glycosyl hydrolase family protein [Cryobacterium mannosilyticum]
MTDVSLDLAAFPAEFRWGVATAAFEIEGAAQEGGDVNDADRLSFLAGYLSAAARALREGVNLQGCYARSFLDNFEWAEGYSKRLGLVYVDYRNQERIPKASARWYADQIARHRICAEAKAVTA